MKLIILFVSALFLLSIIPCSFAKWGETTEVRILDAYGRVLPNAQTNITWEISKSRGYATTKTKLTDARGRAIFLLENIEFSENDTDFQYIVRAKYGNSTAVANYTYNIGETPRTLTLPVYWVTFVTRDTTGKPISMKISIDDGAYLLQTNNDGISTIPIDASNRTAVASYGAFTKRFLLEVGGDKTYNITAKLYNPQVRVLDDAGTPLDAEVHIGEFEKTCDKDGYAKFYNLTDPTPLMTVYYGRHKKSKMLNFDATEQVLVLFDTHPPEIQNVQTEWTGQVLRVLAIIQDKGKYASGLAEGNASIELYYISENNLQVKVPMYAVSYNMYAGDIPIGSGTPVVKYIVQATDAEGNSKSSADTFVIPTSGDGADNNTVEPPINPNPPGGLDIGAILGAATAICLFVALVYWYYKSRKPPSEDAGVMKPEYVYGQKPQAKPAGAQAEVKSAQEKKEEAKPASPPAVPPAAQPKPPS